MGRLKLVAWRVFRAATLTVALSGSVFAAPDVARDPPQAPVTMEVYVRDGCPHCADAKEWLETLRRDRPDVRIVLRPIDRDAAALADLERVSKAAGIAVPGVPTFVVGNRALVGFGDAQNTGPLVLALIGQAAPPAASVESSLFGTLSADRLGLPLFTLALGLLDGFNPCAMWVLLFLLAMLVRQNDRRRIALIAGTFVFVSGAVYYAFMAAWLNVFLAVGLSQPVRFLLAGVALFIGAFNVKDFFALGRGFSFSIPEGTKPGLVARMRGVMQTQALAASLLGVATLAVVVNLVELLCTAGLPAIYTAVLAQQQLGTAAHLAYLGLYIAGYIADDALMVALAVLALSSGKLTERAGRGLKLLSGVVMLALGLVLLLRPAWLV